MNNQTAAPAKRYRFISDPGHGWLEVLRTELVALNIENEISAYSYINGAFAYLEEDCDASRFIDAWKKAHPGEDFPHTNEHQDPTPIRNYRHYTQPRKEAPSPTIDAAPGFFRENGQTSRKPLNIFIVRPSHGAAAPDQIGDMARED